MAVTSAEDELKVRRPRRRSRARRGATNIQDGIGGAANIQARNDMTTISDKQIASCPIDHVPDQTTFVSI